MKNLLFSIVILTIAIFISCGGGKSEKSEEQKPTPEKVIPKKPIPGDREFTPFNVGDKPVNGKNLSQQIQAYYNNILQKEVSVVIAPNFKYLQKGIDIRFNEKGERVEYGPFEICRSFKDPASNLERNYKNKSIVLKGNLRFDILKGKDVSLIEAYFVGAYKGEKIVENRKLTWDDLSIENPVLPGEILQLISPLKGVEVTVTGKVFIDDFKNYVQILGPENEVYITCHFTSRSEQESVIKDGVYTINGKIDDLNLKKGKVWLKDCKLVK